MILISSIIVIAVVIAALLSRRINIPLIIIALAAGIIFGSDVTGLVYFDDARIAQQVANIALVFILFAGGFGIKREQFRPVMRVTMLLATAGVVLTAVITGFLFHFIIGWPVHESILIAAIISSTDAAAVFSILRSRQIRHDVRIVTEIESAANDPMAVILTVFLIELVLGNSFNTATAVLTFTWQLAGGVAIGLITGWLGILGFRLIKELDVGYFYLLLIGIILLSYGAADLVKASGMLSAFFAGLVMGNSRLPYKGGVASFTETLSFIANAILFILLGLLVFPRNLVNIWLPALALFLVLTFAARPLAVFVMTLFTPMKVREKLFVSWSGIRGAVPIVLATYPAAAGLDPEHTIFNIVFLAVTLSILVQGTTIGRLADLLGLSEKKSLKPRQTMELFTVHDTDYELMELTIDACAYEGRCRVMDLGLPLGTTITMVNRDNSIIAPSGQTEILPGDTLSLLVDRSRTEETAAAVLNCFTRIEIDKNEDKSPVC